MIRQPLALPSSIPHAATIIVITAATAVVVPRPPTPSPFFLPPPALILPPSSSTPAPIRPPEQEKEWAPPPPRPMIKNATLPSSRQLAPPARRRRRSEVGLGASSASDRLEGGSGARGHTCVAVDRQTERQGGSQRPLMISTVFNHLIGTRERLKRVKLSWGGGSEDALFRLPVSTHGNGKRGI